MEKQEIILLLENNYKTIIQSNYPASECSSLINSSSDKDKKIVFEWLNKNNILFNSDNYQGDKIMINFKAERNFENEDDFFSWLENLQSKYCEGDQSGAGWEVNDICPDCEQKTETKIQDIDGKLIEKQYCQECDLYL